MHGAIAVADLNKQVADQCDAVSHMARALASVHDDFAKIFRGSQKNDISDIVGKRSARLMEILGDILNGMDAVVEGDEKLDPVFEEAHRRWPADGECPHCGLKPALPDPALPTPADPPEPINNEDQHILICAVRYCIGRMSYVVGSCDRWLRERWPRLSDNTRGVILRDIYEALERDRLGHSSIGMEMDRRIWSALYRDLSERPQP